MKKLLTSLMLAAAVMAPASAQTIVVNNGRVVTNTATGVIENGGVVIRDGAIVDVGSSVSIPDGAEVIDAQGGWMFASPIFGPLPRIDIGP